MPKRMPPCPPNCPLRRPACQGHCPTYEPYTVQLEHDRQCKRDYVERNTRWTDAYRKAAEKACRFNIKKERGIL